MKAWSFDEMEINRDEESKIHSIQQEEYILLKYKNKRPTSTERQDWRDEIYWWGVLKWNIDFMDRARRIELRVYLSLWI